MNLAKRMMGINLLGALALLAVVLTAFLGFQQAKHRWAEYDQTVVREREELQAITAEMGYTGLIHELKNYVLRGDESYYDEVGKHHAQITRALDRYAQIEGLDASELQAIASLREMADRYMEAAQVVNDYLADHPDFVAGSVKVFELDKLIRIDDRPYEQAMQTLQTNADKRTAAHGRALAGYFTQMVLLVVCFAICGMTLILGAGTYLCRRIAADESEKERELNEQRDAAEAASQAKSAFLASVSHEVRTPMTAILGFADLLAEADNDSETQQDYVQTIRRNGEHLLGILNDVLDLSKIESGRMTSEQRQTPMRQLVEEVASLMRVRAIERGLSLEVEFMPNVPDHVWTDPLRLRQVLMNLIGNAIKFTEEGGVRVIVRCNRQHTWLSVEVIDTGIGMGPTQMDRLFKPFAQGDRTMARRFGGTGLGLSLCKRFVEMLGGRLSVSSTPGEGSAFWFNLPIKSEAKPIEQAPAPALKPNSTAQPQPLTGRVLLAEDGLDNQRLIRFMLNKIGLSMDLAENGREAVDMALQAADAGTPYDVILMDMQMPVLDGYCATAELREKGYVGWVVALTAHAMSEDRGRCLRAGCDAYASKPIDKPTLHAVLAERMAISQAA